MPKKKTSKKKKGGKKGKPKLNPDALYDEWLAFTNAELRAADPEGQKDNMNVIDDLCGHSRDWLLMEKGEKVDVQVKTKKRLYKQVVCLYFCDQRNCTLNGTVITPEIAKAYESARAAGRCVEVVFVSMDKKEEAYNEMFADMPWVAIPHGDKQIKWLSRKYNKKMELPKLTVIGQDGRVVLDDGIKKLLLNPNQFPFCKATSNDPVEQAQRRPNGYQCSIESCKCKKFTGGGGYKEMDAPPPEGRKPVMCVECAHSDIYHVPIKKPDEKKKGPVVSKKKK